MHVVTGALGYSGQYIARQLLQDGQRVATLTNSPHRPNPFGAQVQIFPYHFDQPQKLVEALRGARVLYNTYWVRFNARQFKHASAVENTLTLFEAARKAGVERVVHVSITNPSLDSPLEYFSGKARLEQALVQSGLSYAILRPAVLFGRQDILINNIAWLLRRLPVFGIFGDGAYKLQPVYVEDLAGLAVEQGKSRQNIVMDAIGPETFTYRQLVTEIGSIIGCRRPLFSMPPWLGYAAGWVLGKLMGDVLITPEEIRGLMDNLLYTSSPPAVSTRLTDWARQNRATLGRRYASEMTRRKDRSRPYLPES